MYLQGLLFGIKDCKKLTLGFLHGNNVWLGICNSFSNSLLCVFLFIKLFLFLCCRFQLSKFVVSTYYKKKFFLPLSSILYFSCKIHLSKIVCFSNQLSLPFLSHLFFVLSSIFLNFSFLLSWHFSTKIHSSNFRGHELTKISCFLGHIFL